MTNKKDSQELSQQKPADTSLSNMTVDALVSQRNLITEAMKTVMKRDVDYGRIGGGDKDSLLQPGAQKLCMVFRLAPVFESREVFEGNHLTIKSNCIIRHAPTGMVLGSGEGMCTTKEKKYAKRKDGGKVVDNANLPDLYNTVLKMANKRALVAAVLNVTAAGDIFTQDMADEKDTDDGSPAPLVVPDTETPPTPAEIVRKAEEKHSEKKANGYAPDTVPAPKNGSTLKWSGKVDSIAELELPDGKPCWEIKGSDGTIFKTAEKDCYDLANEAGSNAIDIEYKLNGKGTRVIHKLRCEALV